jgi:hypothetical protein
MTTIGVLESQVSLGVNSHLKGQLNLAAGNERRGVFARRGEVFSVDEDVEIGEGLAEFVLAEDELGTMRFAEEFALRIDKGFIDEHTTGGKEIANRCEQWAVEKVEASHEVEFYILDFGFLNFILFEVNWICNHTDTVAAGECFALRQRIRKDIPGLHIEALLGEVDGIAT